MLLVLAACHSPASRPPDPEPPSSQRGGEPAAQPQAPSDTPSTQVPPELAVLEPPPPLLGVTPPGVIANQTTCEAACAEVHDCALLDPTYTPAAAASIELGCLDVCVYEPETSGQLFGCARPSAIDPPGCTPFLTCLGPSWPEPDYPEEIPDPYEEPFDSGHGCELTCEAFAHCVNPSAPPEAILQCAKECEAQLSDEQARSFKTCSDLSDCQAIIACVLATPGA